MSIKKHVFSALEKKTFVDISVKYSQVIERKDTDGATLRAKNEAWDKITREYNASPHATMLATNKQLRRLWMNLKQRQREYIRAHTKERQHLMATGGGPSTSDVVKTTSKDPDIPKREYRDRRAEELHELEMELMRHRIREAKAKADLAEYILQQRRSANVPVDEEGREHIVGTIITPKIQL